MNYWLKKFDTKQEASGATFFFFFWERKEGKFAPFHALPSTQWQDSKGRTEIPRSLAPTFSKIMGKFGKFKSCSISFLGIMSHEVHITYSMLNMWKLLLQVMCCLLGTEGNLLHCRVSVVKTIKALPDTLTSFETIVKECDFESLRVYRRQAVPISSAYNISPYDGII